MHRFRAATSSVAAGLFVALSAGFSLGVPTSAGASAPVATNAQGSSAKVAEAPAAKKVGFTLAVVPDTQTEVFRNDTRLRDRFTWLAQKKAQLDLRFVAHVGDLTNWGWLVPRQLEVASAGLEPLEDAGIPYSVAVGNHDTRAVGWNGKKGYGGRAYADNPECLERFDERRCTSEFLLRQTQEINQVFDAQRFGAVSGEHRPGRIDNVYSTFRGGGLRWLVLDLEMWPRPGVVRWANEVVAAHPQHNVVVNTHFYLSARNNVPRNSGYGSASPRDLWDQLISQHRNIVLVVSGHVAAQASTHIDHGVHGNQVVSLLTAFDKSGTNPVRLVRFNTTRGVIKTRIVAPATGDRFPEHRARISGMHFVG